MKSIFFGLVALASAVIAEGDYFQIRTPKKGTTLVPGEVSTIRWTEGLKGKVLINILKGDDPHVMVPTGMAFTTLGEQNVQRWRVPSNLDSTDTYALEFNFKLPSGEITQSFSDQFKIAAAVALPMTEVKEVDSEQSMPKKQVPNKLSSFFDGPSSNMGETNTMQRQAPVSSTGGQQKMGYTSPNMKNPAREKMRIIIQYPEEEEEMGAGAGAGASPVKSTGSIRTNSVDTMSSDYGYKSVLDAAAAEAAAAETKYPVGSASLRSKARSASAVKSASVGRGSGVVKAASKNKSVN